MWIQERHIPFNIFLSQTQTKVKAMMAAWLQKRLQVFTPPWVNAQWVVTLIAYEEAESISLLFECGLALQFSLAQ